MEKLTGLLHLCKKAGKLIMGQKSVFSCAAKGQLSIIIMACDAGSALKRKFFKFKTIHINWTSDQFGEIFGRNRLSIVGITDPGLAAQVEKIIRSGNFIVL